jgi:PiT family inorganic phosphate transporter
LASSHLGFALSTTHVASGSIVGTGVGKRGAVVRWGVAGRMVLAWVVTLPAAGLVGALMWSVGNGLGGYTGPLFVFTLLVLTASLLYLRSRLQPVSAANVNDDWDGMPAATRSRTEVPA